MSKVKEENVSKIEKIKDYISGKEIVARPEEIDAVQPF